MISQISLLPDEHIYSGIVRCRFLSGQMHISDRVFFELNHLPYHWLRSQTPLCENLNAVLRVVADSVDEQYQLRLWNTPFSPWLLSMPSNIEPWAMTESGVRNNMEESAFNVDKRWKFCPECAEENRNQYGVSYWHSSHQLLGSRVCGIHGCALHSHVDLRYLRFKLPQHFLHNSELLDLNFSWQHEWQLFIYRLSAHLQRQPEWARKISQCVKYHLNIDDDIKHTHRPLFNDIFERMKTDLGAECLAGLFTRYARQNGRMPNILWVTLSGHSKVKGFRHPLYWLAILFWLRNSLPELSFLYENGSVSSP